MAIFRNTAKDLTTNDRSAGDRKRHREKVRQAIKENLGNILSEEAIIGKSGDKKIKVPIKGIKEYRFIFGNNSGGAGQGEGGEQPGDVINTGQNKGKGIGNPGSEPGEDIYETEITLDEIIELLLEDLELPDLEKKKLREIQQEKMLKKRGYKKSGIRVRLSRKRTAIQRIKRKKSFLRALNELNKTQKKIRTNSLAKAIKMIKQRKNIAKKRFPFHNDDLRYNRVTPKIKKHSNAVVFCIMDTSGSMDIEKKYMARSFYFLLYKFIKVKYQNTEIVFIAHHTEAKEVTEDEFFHKAESGGTKISSGYKKALEIIEDRYNPSLWNIYAFHCSDGDNFDDDNENAVLYALKLSEIANLFGYGEIKPDGSINFSSMLKLYEKIISENFSTVSIRQRQEIFPALKKFLNKEKD